jgi:hypothetical protein
MQKLAALLDQGGRRSGRDRREFVYFGHIPERRSGIDRRTVKDRRSGLDRRDESPSKVVDMAEWRDRRSSSDRRNLPPPYRPPQYLEESV